MCRDGTGVNLKSYFLMAKHSLPSMLESKAGVIINIGSVQGSQSQVGIPAYASSKGAVLSLTRQMAMDYSSEGIRTVSVSPGTSAFWLPPRRAETPPPFFPSPPPCLPPPS